MATLLIASLQSKKSCFEQLLQVWVASRLEEAVSLDEEIRQRWDRSLLHCNRHKA